MRSVWDDKNFIGNNEDHNPSVPYAPNSKMAKA